MRVEAGAREGVRKEMKCKWIKFIDWWQICEAEPKELQDMSIEELLEVKIEPQGSWFGWFLCSLACSNYTKGFDYDKMQDVCTCRGKWNPPAMWRR